MVFVFVFASCNKPSETKNEIELISFSHNLTSGYTFNESVELKIQIKNNNNYRVLSYQISDETINVEESQKDYHDFTHTFALEVGRNIFTLQKITYEKSTDEGPLELEIHKDNIITVNRNVGNLVDDKVAVGLSIEDVKEVYYNGDKIKLHLTFDNPQGFEIKTVKINGDNIILASGTIEEITQEMTVKGGLNYFEVSEITYIVDGKVKTLNFEECPRIEFPVSTTGIVPTDFVLMTKATEDVYSYSSTHIAVTTNKKITFRVKATNTDNLRLTKIVLDVNGEKKQVTKWDSSSSTQLYDYYNFDISFSDSNISAQNIKLDSVEFQDKKGTGYSNAFSNSKTYKIEIYDKVIKTYTDFLNIKNKADGKYILGNDIKIDSTNKSIVESFSGRLNGNGYDVIGGSHILNTPIFETISSKGVVENIRFVKIEFVNPNANVDFSCFAKTNNGTISNVTFDQISISNNSTSESTSTTAFVKTNNGTIKDIYLQTSTIVSNGTIYGICQNNYGRVERVVANYADFKPFSTGGLKAIYFTMKNVYEDAIFANSYFENGAGRNAYYRLAEGADYVLGPSNVEDGATVSGIYYNGNLKTTSDMWESTDGSYNYKIKKECADKWFEENITEISNTNARKESFFNSVLGFNAGSDEDVVWRIEDGRIPRLSNSYSGK